MRLGGPLFKPFDDPDILLILKHLKGEEEYAKAGEHVRSIAKKIGLTCN